MVVAHLPVVAAASEERIEVLIALPAQSHIIRAGGEIEAEAPLRLRDLAVARRVERIAEIVWIAVIQPENGIRRPVFADDGELNVSGMIQREGRPVHVGPSGRAVTDRSRQHGRRRHTQVAQALRRIQGVIRLRLQHGHLCRRGWSGSYHLEQPGVDRRGAEESAVLQLVDLPIGGSAADRFRRSPPAVNRLEDIAPQILAIGLVSHVASIARRSDRSVPRYPGT